MANILRGKGRVRIKDLPVSLRPREKLISGGAQNLRDGELVALLLATGSVKQNAVALGELLLRRYPLGKLADVSVQELAAIAGVGNSKASRVLAAIELGKRLFSQTALSTTTVRSIGDLLVLLKNIAEKRQEYLVVFYLNARNELLQKEIVGVGTLNSVVITPRDIFGPALQISCASLFVAHNHPSGDPSPSEADIAFTKRMHKAGEMLGIILLDHLIIAKNGYFAFSENRKGVL